jgi:hypothetical protein
LTAKDFSLFYNRMNRLIALLFVLSCISAQARVGETMAQCEERYGPVVEKKPPQLSTSDKEACVFSKNGITILVEFKGGVAWRVVYRMLDFDPDSISKLLLANAVEGGWSKMLKLGNKEVRAAPNRERLAVFVQGKRSLDSSVLEVVSAEYAKANAKEYEAKLTEVPELVKMRISSDPTKPF